MAIHLSLMSPEHLDDYKLCAVLTVRVHLQCQFDPPRPSFYHTPLWVNLHLSSDYGCMPGRCPIMFVLVQI